MRSLYYYVTFATSTQDFPEYEYKAMNAERVQVYMLDYIWVHVQNQYNPDGGLDTLNIKWKLGAHEKCYLLDRLVQQGRGIRNDCNYGNN